MKVIPILKNLVRFFILTVLLANCDSRKQKLINAGYQVFDKYDIAIKTPCQFEIDESIKKDPSLGNYLLLVCPQIFKDTSRSTLYLDRLINSDRKIYHLRFFFNEDSLDPESRIYQQKEILNSLGISHIEEKTVSGKTCLIYEIEQKSSTEAFLTQGNISYHISVSGDSYRQELVKVLKEVKIGI